MGLPPKQAGDCHAAVPFEFTDSPAKISQNVKNLMKEIAELKCRPISCEQLREVLSDPDCNICDLLCCPPCEPVLERRRGPIAFDGKPFENIYADGKIWIGDIEGLNGRIYAVYDPINETKLKDLLPGDISGSGMMNDCGFGACWRMSNNEVWVSGYNSNNAILRVYDAATMVAKVEYEYAGTRGSSPSPIEWCPLGDTIFAGIQADDFSYSMIQVDPSDGSIIKTFKATNTDGFEDEAIYYITWHGGEHRMYASLLRDQHYNVAVGSDGSAGDAGAIGCPVGGLIDTGHKVPESVWSPVSGLLYNVPDKHTDLYFHRTQLLGTPIACPVGGFPEVLIDWAGTTADQAASHVEWLDATQSLIVSRGDDSIIFSNPNTTGLVQRISESGGVQQTWEVQFSPARVAWAPIANKVSVVAWWNQDTEWFVEFLPVQLLPGQGGGGGGGTGGGVPGGGSSGGSGGGGGPGSSPDPDPIPPPPEDDPSSGGDTDGDGLPAPGVEDPLNGPALNVTGSRGNVLGLVDADSGGHPGPTVTLNELFVKYTPGGRNPTTPWGPGYAEQSVSFNVEVQNAPVPPGPNAFEDLLPSVYVMRAGEHPTTHPTVDPESLDTAVRKLVGSTYEENLWHGGVNYDTEQSVPPASAAGSVPIDLDFYFRWEKNDPLIPGIWVSHWTVFILRTFTPADPE